jgi:hypothetical protein
MPKRFGKSPDTAVRKYNCYLVEVLCVKYAYAFPSSSGVDHGFTEWGNNAYDALADWRSWDAMLSVFEMVLKEEGQEEAPPTIFAASAASRFVSWFFGGLMVMASLAAVW